MGKKRHIALNGKPATGMKANLHFARNKKGSFKILSGSDHKKRR